MSNYTTKNNPLASPGRTFTEYQNAKAFAALKSDGSVVTWGHGNSGGDSGSVSKHLKDNVCQIFSHSYGFAALKNDGSVVRWGGWSGTDSSTSNNLKSGVKEISSTRNAFAALKNNGSVVTWGYFGSLERQSQVDLLATLSRFSLQGVPLQH